MVNEKSAIRAELNTDSDVDQIGRDLVALVEASQESSPTTHLPAVPALFQSGLCKGFPLLPSPDQYFVAQEFSPDRADLLNALSTAFAGFKLLPYRADEDVLPGGLLCKICSKLMTTEFGVFELTASQNRNVYLELGIALGLRKPYVLVKEPDAKVPPLAEGFEHYTFHGYRRMGKELGKLSETYLLDVARFHGADLIPAASSPTYVIAHGDYDMPEDFCLAIQDAVGDRGLSPIPVGADNRGCADALETESGLLIEARAEQTHLAALIQAIQTAQFGVYRVDAGCSADAFLALGIAIGLGRPWLLAARNGALLPVDVRGLALCSFSSFEELGTRFAREYGTMLDQITPKQVGTP